jgi:DNA-nicking Smr family endonuclease
MAGRRLLPEEQALWEALARTVRPLRRPRPLPVPPPPPAEPAPPRVRGRVPPPRAVPLPVAPAAGPGLDGRWERHLRRGDVAVDRTVDLHGYTLADARRVFDAALHAALAAEARLLLVITGRPRDPGSGRGAIRAEIGHWIDASPFADRIAAVRPAHPRHGGAGALYLVLRRRR